MVEKGNVPNVEYALYKKKKEGAYKRSSPHCLKLRNKSDTSNSRSCENFMKKVYNF